MLGGAAQQLAGEEVEALGLEVGQDPLEVRVPMVRCPAWGERKGLE